ncbi:hypothetical protein D3C73_875130 [compost metagenome]
MSDIFFTDGEPLPPPPLWYWDRGLFLCGLGLPSDKCDSLYYEISLYAPIGSNGDVWRMSNTILFNDHSGKMKQYRFHIVDPIFRESLRFLIEHGHGTPQSNDYSSVAYWYQSEPHNRTLGCCPFTCGCRCEKESAKQFSGILIQGAIEAYNTLVTLTDQIFSKAPIGKVEIST